jgi:hypothetical protein
MAKKSKQFVVATEGATVDGRTIERVWIEQMAANYDPAKYKAGINIEHIRSLMPDSPFKNYGYVEALATKENAEGKLQLLATITPSDDLVKLVKGFQKTFTSMEVNPKFADSGEAYLQGLAVTDTPASLGTDMLEFTAGNPDKSPLTARKQSPGNYFSVAVETTLEFIDVVEAPGILDKVRKLFARKDASDNQRFSDVEKAIEEIAEHGQTQSNHTAEQLQQVDADIKASAVKVADLLERLSAVESKLDTTPAPTTMRPFATGNTTDVKTDF